MDTATLCMYMPKFALVFLISLFDTHRPRGRRGHSEYTGEVCPGTSKKGVSCAGTARKKGCENVTYIRDKTWHHGISKILFIHDSLQ